VSRAARLVIAAVLSLGFGCVNPSETEITKDRAIEIAREQVRFQADTVEAARTTSNNRPVWRVTLRGRLPGQPPGLFESAIVDVDRRNGEIVSIARP
jgi:Peptidase propeptide and YPEB domain